MYCDANELGILRFSRLLASRELLNRVKQHLASSISHREPFAAPREIDGGDVVEGSLLRRPVGKDGRRGKMNLWMEGEVSCEFEAKRESARRTSLS